MPPKKAAGPSKKAVEGKQKKIVEDKTFGLKNKNKSKKVQQYVQTVEKQVKFAGRSTKETMLEEKARAEKKATKEATAALQAEMATLFKAVVDNKKQAIPAGADPKSILCEFFKKGNCVRGNKCKFSHDLEQARKVAKIDIYSDPREAQNMSQWDQNTLEDVIQKKAAAKGGLPPTDIVCKYFLDAIEKSQYGWLWECPNGETCHYRHALPQGYVLKSQKTTDDDEEEDEEMDIGEEIEEARKKLDLSKCRPVTLELFNEWKIAKQKQKAEEVEKKRVEEQKKSGGKGFSALSGRDLFRYDPSLFVDDADADDETYEISGDYEEEEEGQDKNENSNEAQSSSGSELTADEQANVVQAFNDDLYLDDETLPEEDEDQEEGEDQEGDEEEAGEEEEGEDQENGKDEKK